MNYIALSRWHVIVVSRSGYYTLLGKIHIHILSVYSEPEIENNICFCFSNCFKKYLKSLYFL